jgi:Fur family ferric uptake transcriptional regulator
LHVPRNFVIEKYDLILYGQCSDCVPKH